MTQKEQVDRKTVCNNDNTNNSTKIKYFVIQMQIWPKDSKPLQRTILIMLLIFGIL